MFHNKAHFLLPVKIQLNDNLGYKKAISALDLTIDGLLHTMDITSSSDNLRMSFENTNKPNSIPTVLL